MTPTAVLSTQPAVRARQARWPVSIGPGKRALQIALGSVWLLDAALQFQPFMFTRQFVTTIIAPTAAGNPAAVTRLILWSAHLMEQHIALYNALFALAQLAIAVGFFSRRTVKLAIACSIAWAVFVWFFGEGLGGVLTGASPLMGLPGAVLLYAFIALLIWPSDGQPGTRAKTGWMVLWAALGCYQLLPANRAPGAVSSMFAGAAAMVPSWLRPVETGLASLTSGHGLIASALIWAACLAAGLGVASTRLTRPALVLAVLLAALFWAAEGFGGLTTGQATDPNSGPLLVLLAACFWLLPASASAATSLPL
ncbi:MAG TPA: hypothetical protein VMA95_15125 [Streptosporangiaceae bacterium]|nr:hypothetical protein [Streptosporangiaceae bacterium]